jgi:hypothetical protein
MESLKRIKEAIEKLQDLRYSAADASIIGLVILDTLTRQSELLKKGFANLDNQLKDWLVQISVPVEREAFDGSGTN